MLLSVLFISKHLKKRTTKYLNLDLIELEVVDGKIDVTGQSKQKWVAAVSSLSKWS